MNKRRKLLFALSGVSATTVWTRPVVDAVMLPVHAETTESILPTAPTPAPTPEPKPEPKPKPKPKPKPDEVVEWRLENVGFTDDGAVSGSFTYNFTNDTATDWNITVSGGFTGTFSERSYTMANSTFENTTRNLTFRASNKEGRRIEIVIESPLTSAGGTLLLDFSVLNNNLERNVISDLSFVARRINSGSLVGTVV